MPADSSYDYIILGAGLAGLSLAVRFTEDSYFENKRILILDKQDKIENDRTWCYWNKGEDPYESIVSKRWDRIRFKSNSFKRRIPLSPYSYKKIEGGDFYRFCKEKITKHPLIDFKVEAFKSFEETGDEVHLSTEKQTYTCRKLFSSILLPEVLATQDKYQVLNQHFIGWFIKTEKDVFDPNLATFMDFSIPQKGNTRFMYILPTSPTEALLEYTLFSEDVLPDRVYENGIKRYIKKLKIEDYSIVTKEQGVIPMTVYPFEKQNSSHVAYIGTAGGWTRASTGYTFTYTKQRTAQLVEFVKKHDDFTRFKINDRYRWYDSLLLDVLYRKNKMGAALFSAMFQKNKVDRIFRFLDGTSSLVDDLKIISSLPKKEFVKALFRTRKPRK